jgi:hypothetical protein
MTTPSACQVIRLPKNWADALSDLVHRRPHERALARRLRDLQHHQEVFAKAADSVVCGRGPYTLEDALCSAETIQSQLSELAEHLAALSLARILMRRG